MSESSLYDSIERALRLGDTPKLISLLAQHPPPAVLNFIDQYGYALLHSASHTGHVDAVRALASAGADVNIANQKFGGTPLHQTAESGGDGAKAKVLIDAGANVNALDQHGEAPLHFAAYRGNCDVVKVFIGAGADLDIGTKTPLECCLFMGHHERARLLAEAGAHIDPAYEAAHADELRLWTAVLRGDLKELVRRINAGDNVDQAPQGGKANGWTALWLAVALGREDAARMLVAVGAKPNAGSKMPLFEALHHRRFVLAKLLASAGACIEPKYEAEHAKELRLWTAVLRGDLDELRRRIDAGDSVDQVYQGGKTENSGISTGWTPLWLAVALAREDVVRILVQAGANLNLGCGFEKNTPLHDSIEAGCLDMVKLLVELGADVNSVNHWRSKPITLAAKKGYNEIVRVLAAANADLSAQYGFGSTPLHIAAEHGFYDVAKTLVDSQANIEAKDWNDNTPLYEAAEHGHADIAKLLLDTGANPNIVDKIGRTPLTSAINNGHTEVAKVLVEGGADVNAVGKNGYSPLYIALFKGLDNIAKVLIEDGACIDPEYEAEHANELRLWRAVLRGSISKLLRRIDAGENVDEAPQGGKAAGLTAFRLAVKLGREDATRALANTGADVDAVDENGQTPLHEAVEKGNLEMVKILVDSSAEIDILDQFSRTPLFIALEKGFCEIAKTLIEAEADVNIVCKNFCTALHIASMNGQTDVMTPLIEAGADVDAVNKAGQTPLHIIAGNGNCQIAKLLLDAGADVNAAGKNGRTPLHFALDKDQCDMAKLLVAAGANVNAISKSGFTPLHLASAKGHILVAQQLLDAGAAIDAVSKKGLTPLHLAVHGGHCGVVRVLMAGGADPALADSDGQTPMDVAEVNTVRQLVSALMRKARGH